MKHTSSKTGGILQVQSQTLDTLDRCLTLEKFEEEGEDGEADMVEQSGPGEEVKLPEQQFQENSGEKPLERTAK